MSSLLLVWTRTRIWLSLLVWNLEIDSNFGGYRVNAELEAQPNVWVVRILEHFSFHINFNTGS
jgi:hypothetical protein